jgi:hypothetical protein
MQILANSAFSIESDRRRHDEMGRDMLLFLS